MAYRSVKISLLVSIVAIIIVAIFYPYRPIFGVYPIVKSVADDQVTISYKITGSPRLCNVSASDLESYRIGDAVFNLVFNQYNLSNCLVNGAIYQFTIYFHLTLLVVGFICLSSTVCYFMLGKPCGFYFPVAPAPTVLADINDSRLVSVTETDAV